MFSICKSGKDKYFIMHKLKHAAPHNGADAPGKASARQGGPAYQIVKVIR